MDEGGVRYEDQRERLCSPPAVCSPRTTPFVASSRQGFAPGRVKAEKEIGSFLC